MMPRGRRSRVNLQVMPEVSLTPLIDTALVLLVIFMVATPVMHNAIKVDLPKGQAQEAQGDAQEIVISIKKTDTGEIIFVNDEPVKLDNIIQTLEKKIGSKKDQKVFVNADKSISYGSLINVVDTVKYLGGIEHVVLSTEKG